MYTLTLFSMKTAFQVFTNYKNKEKEESAVWAADSLPAIS